MSNLIGNIGETSFIYHATKYGLEVMVPFGVMPYDCVIFNSKKFFKIQIKATNKLCPIKNRYKVNVAANTYDYNSKLIDFIVGYIVSLNCFYIIPVSEIKTKTIRLYPHKQNHRLNKYKEAWELLL